MATLLIWGEVVATLWILGRVENTGWISCLLIEIGGILVGKNKRNCRE